MNRTNQSIKTILLKGLAILICFAVSFTYIPFVEDEGGTVDAASMIELGDYLQMGTYYDEPILWRCVGFYKVDNSGKVDLSDTLKTYKDGYLPLMLSDRILCLKAFDASGDVETGSHARGKKSGPPRQTNPTANRKNYGSNYWGDSNIRCWLNSDAAAGEVKWSCGNPPDKDHLIKGLNSYEDEAGFLTHFTAKEKLCMKSVTQHQLLDKYEYEGKEEEYHEYYLDIDKCVANFNEAYKEPCTDTVFLLDVNQVNLVYQNREKLGEEYYKGKPTEECVINSDFKLGNLNTNEYWDYWLRTPNADHYNSPGRNTSCEVRSVRVDGQVFSYDAYIGEIGIRPAFYLDVTAAGFSSGDGSEDSPYVVGESDGCDKLAACVGLFALGTWLSFKWIKGFADWKCLLAKADLWKKAHCCCCCKCNPLILKCWYNNWHLLRCNNTCLRC